MVGIESVGEQHPEDWPGEHAEHFVQQGGDGEQRASLKKDAQNRSTSVVQRQQDVAAEDRNQRKRDAKQSDDRRGDERC